MIVLHGIWSHRQFHLWAEDSDRPRSVLKRRGRKPKKPKPHPCAVAAPDVAEAIGDLSAGLVAAAGEHDALTLQLPTDSAGPLDSPEVIRDESSPPHGATRLAAWIVPSLRLAPADALDLLVDLPEAPPPGAAFGQSLTYWREAAKFVMELMVGEQFYPDLANDADTWRATWRPLLDEADASERARVLARAMPPVCRAVVSQGAARGSAQLCADFIRVALDASVRRSLKAAALLPKRRKRKAKSLAQRWVAALGDEAKKKLEEIGDAVTVLQKLGKAY